MRFWDDGRAQAIQIGAVLLFGLLVISFATYQAFVVPNQNEEVEFNHNQNVQKQLQDLRNTIVSMTGEATDKSETVDLGVRYPSRVVALNPGPASGSLRTIGTTDPNINVSLANAAATGETGDFWDGSTRNFTTGGFVYRPTYSEYRGAPTTIYENSVLYNVFRGQNVTLAGQQLVSDKRITVVTLNGSYAQTRAGSTTVDFRSVSSSTQRVTIENVSTSEPINLTVPTRLGESKWRDILEGEFTNQGGYIVDLENESLPDSEFQLLHIEMESDVTYQLRMARVGMGTRVERPDPAYVTDIRDNGTSVPEGGSEQVVVEVRDRFNNPVSGVLVNTTAVTGDISGSRAGITDSDGQVSVTYEAPDDIDGAPQSDSVRVSFIRDPATLSSFDDSTPENLTMDLTVENTDGSGTSSGGGNVYSISFDKSQIGTNEGVTCYSNNCTYDLADDSSDSRFNVTVTTDPTVVGADVDFGLNTTDYGTYVAEESETDNSGDAEAEFDTTSTGSVKTYVTSGGSGDSLDLNLTNTADGETVISAFQPDPDKVQDSNGEFVRIYFPSSTDTTGWTLEDDEQSTSLPSESLSGEVYFARDPSSFSQTWSISSSRVYELDTVLANSGEPLWLNDSSGVVDSVGYNGNSPNGFSGSVTGLDSGDVAYRTQTGGVYDDTDDQGDWATEEENVFFNGRGGNAPSAGVVFQDDSYNQPYAKSIDTSGTVGFFDVTSPAGFSQMADFDNDGNDELIYVDQNDNVRSQDYEGNSELLLDSNDVSASPTRLAVGDFDNTGQRIYFSNSNSRLHSLTYVDGGQNTVRPVTDSSDNKIAASAVAGVGDFDGTDELVFADDNGNLKYLTSNGTDPVQIQYLQGQGQGSTKDVSVNTAKAISSLADLDDDGDIEVAYYDNGDISHVDSTDDNPVTFSTNYDVSEGPLAVLEVDGGNSAPEVVHVNPNAGSDGELHYVGDELTESALTDEFGFGQPASGDSPGVVG